MSCGRTYAFPHTLLDRLHHTFDETITLRVTRARRDVVKAVLVCKGCKLLRREWGAVVCHNGLRHSIFAKHLPQNLGGSARVGAAYFPDHWKPTLVVCYQEVGSRLKLEEINS